MSSHPESGGFVTGPAVADVNAVYVAAQASLASIGAKVTANDLVASMLEAAAPDVVTRPVQSSRRATAYVAY